MGFLENFFSIFNNKEKNFDKVGDILKNKITTTDQRSEAFSELEKLSPELAVPQILKRFMMVIDSGIQDIKEKERSLNYLIRFPEITKPLIIEFIEKQPFIAWPCRVAEKLLTEEEYLDLLLKNLNLDHELFDDEAVQKNIELLIALKELKNEKIIPIASKFLDKRDEHLVIAALECLEEQATKYSDAKNLILNYVSKEVNDQNSRIIGLSKAIAEKHHW